MVWTSWPGREMVVKRADVTALSQTMQNVALAVSWTRLDTIRQLDLKSGKLTEVDGSWWKLMKVGPTNFDKVPHVVMRKSHFALCMNCMNQWQLCFARPFHGSLCTPRENPHLELEVLQETSFDSWLCWTMLILWWLSREISFQCTARNSGAMVPRSQSHTMPEYARHNATSRHHPLQFSPLPFFVHVCVSVLFVLWLGMGVDDTDEGSHQQGLIWFPEESVKSWLRHTKTNMHFGDHGNKLKSWAKSWWRPVRNNLSQQLYRSIGALCQAGLM